MSRPTKLSESEIASRLAELRGWQRSRDSITRTFTFAGFPDAVSFVRRIVPSAEQMNHHPDVDIRYNRVIITLSTHDQGGLTGYDFDLAGLIDGAVAG